ncbi:MAG TPA: alpha/beta hydrolase [Bryobacteraceae bacterium]|nr:alpha/beta hydrolase [Bryobacteraceae bacterium]
MLRFIMVATALCCTGCSPLSPQQSTPTGSGGFDVSARFGAAPCAFKVPRGARVRCGWLTVPENRSKPSGRTIRLHVAIYGSRSAQPAPDPIVWLVGGPGGRAHVLSSNLFERVVEPYLGSRDFIVVDVRGTGYSEPALNCPDPSGPASQWLPACRERLSSIADLTSYNSAAVAADLADLRRALGIREWNLLGESYGTRLALVAMRDQSQGIRAVILDSVVPPEVDEYADGPAKFESAMSALFRDCVADLSCNTAFPNLGEVLLKAADQLDQSPRRISGVWRGTPFEFRFDGRQLLEALHMALYESDLIQQIPKAIYGAVDGSGDTVWREAIARHAIAVAKDLVDNGAHLSFHCTEEIPFTDAARLRVEDGKRPWMRHTASGVAIVNACRLWIATNGDARETRPVKSEIPVLLLAGEYDPVTPPVYAESAARHLRNSHLFVIPGLGHWLTANPVSMCPQRIALEFLDNPNRRPDAGCLKEWKVRWAIR